MKKRPSDLARLTRAFTALEDASRIAARQKHSCCQSCGIDALRKDMDDDPSLIGFVFYNIDDEERAEESGIVRLAYGSREETDAADKAIATEVIRVLRECLLSASWSGDPSQRIIVHVPLWPGWGLGER